MEVEGTTSVYIYQMKRVLDEERFQLSLFTGL